MWDKEMIIMLAEGTADTLYMTLVSTLFGYILGLPMGIIPFLILLILVIPVTKAIVGKSYGPSGTVVPLVIAAAPFIARLVESSLKEVDHGVVEAAMSMGAGTGQIIGKVMLAEARTSLLVGVTIAIGTILGYSAMAGVVGGGGLGDIAIRYGYYRYETDVMVVTIVDDERQYLYPDEFSNGFFRFSVGIEDVEDSIGDLAQALEKTGFKT